MSAKNDDLDNVWISISDRGRSAGLRQYLENKI